MSSVTDPARRIEFCVQRAAQLANLQRYAEAIVHVNRAQSLIVETSLSILRETVATTDAKRLAVLDAANAVLRSVESDLRELRRLIDKSIDEAAANQALASGTVGRA